MVLTSGNVVKVVAKAVCPTMEGVFTLVGRDLIALTINVKLPLGDPATEPSDDSANVKWGVFRVNVGFNVIGPQ